MGKRTGVPPCYFCICGDHAWAPILNGRITVVDASDASHLQRRFWHTHPEGYVQAGGGTNRELLHRSVLTVGDAEWVDHRDPTKRWDNRRQNIRPCAPRQNVWHNRAFKGTASGFKGVDFHRGSKKWRARITANGVTKYLGEFWDREDAALAYNEAALASHGEFARLNEVA